MKTATVPNEMCRSCPRYTPGYTYSDSESEYTAHRCPGTACPVWTGCVRKPYNPLARVLGLTYDVDAEQWVPAPKKGEC